MKKKLTSLFISLIVYSSAFGQFEMRDASHEPIPSFIESHYDVEGKKTKVYIGQVALITSEDIKEAFAITSGSTTLEGKTEPIYGVSIVLTRSGAEKMKRITEKRIRQPLAFMIDGKVLSVPTVMSALSTRAMITGFTEQGAEELAKKIMDHNQSR